MTYEDIIILTDEQYLSQLKYYLTTKDWWEDKEGRWHDKTKVCRYVCHINVAHAVQLTRDRYNAMPWYKKLWGKL